MEVWTSLYLLSFHPNTQSYHISTRSLCRLTPSPAAELHETVSTSVALFFGDQPDHSSVRHLRTQRTSQRLSTVRQPLVVGKGNSCQWHLAFGVIDCGVSVSPGAVTTQSTTRTLSSPLTTQPVNFMPPLPPPQQHWITITVGGKHYTVRRDIYDVVSKVASTKPREQARMNGVKSLIPGVISSL